MLAELESYSTADVICLQVCPRQPAQVLPLALPAPAGVSFTPTSLSGSGSCLQECDRLPDVLSALPSHKAVHAKRSWQAARSGDPLPRCEMASTSDENGLPRLEELDPAGSGSAGEARSPDQDEDGQARRRRGGTRETKNVGLIVGLEDEDGQHGVVIATTHSNAKRKGP